jgi:phospholipid transport system substrate-binding protein
MEYILITTTAMILAAFSASAADSDKMEVKFSDGKSYKVGTLDLISEQIKESDPKEFANKVSERVLAILQASADENEKEKRLISLFQNHVDTEWMAHFVLGRYTKTADDSQLGKFNDLYKDYMLNSYVPRFKSYSGQGFEVLRVQDSAGDKHVAQMKIKQKDPSKPDIRVDYVFHQDAKGNFKIIDIIGEGVSLISTQRSDFGGIISKDGMDKFLEVLGTKVSAIKGNKA